MTTIRVFSEDSLHALKRDHERLRYEVHQLRTMLRSYSSELDDCGGNSVAVTEDVIPGRVGSTPGGPVLVQRKRINSTPEFVDDGQPVNVYSWVESDSSTPAAGGMYIFIEQDSHGIWWFTGEDC